MGRLRDIPICSYINDRHTQDLFKKKSGGLQIFMQSLGPHYIEMGVDPEILHRIAAIAAGGLDSLPHCGAVIATFMIMGITHKEAYRDIFVVTVAVPVIACLASIALLMSLGMGMVSAG